MKNANIVAKNSMIILNFVTVNVKIVMKRWWIKTAIKSSILH